MESESTALPTELYPNKNSSEQGGSDSVPTYSIIRSTMVIVAFIQRFRTRSDRCVFGLGTQQDYICVRDNCQRSMIRVDDEQQSIIISNTSGITLMQPLVMMLSAVDGLCKRDTRCCSLFPVHTRCMAHTNFSSSANCKTFPPYPGSTTLRSDSWYVPIGVSLPTNAGWHWPAKQTSAKPSLTVTGSITGECA